MYINTRSLEAVAVSLAQEAHLVLRATDEQQEGKDANGTSNTAVIAVLAIIGGIFGIGILYMFYGCIMSKKYGEAIDD